MGAALNLFALRKDGTEFPVDIMLEPLTARRHDCAEHRPRCNRAARRRRNWCGIRICSFVRCSTACGIMPSTCSTWRGTSLTWNPGAERIKRYTAEEIIGKHFSRFFTQEDVERGRPEELLKLAAQRGRVEDEGWRVRKDGSRFWAEHRSDCDSGLKPEN